MNLREYAAHRKERGLSGTTKVAVFYAAKNGRLPGSARLVGGNWEIGVDLADVEWELNKRNPSMRLTAEGGITAAKTSAGATVSKEDVSGPIPDLVRAESEKRRAEADLKMIEVSKRRGELLEASKIGPLIFQRHRAFRDAVLNIPVRVVDAIAAELGDLDTSKRHKIRVLIEAECRRVMEDLAKNPLLEIGGG